MRFGGRLDKSGTEEFNDFFFLGGLGGPGADAGVTVGAGVISGISAASGEKNLGSATC